MTRPCFNIVRVSSIVNHKPACLLYCSISHVLPCINSINKAGMEPGCCILGQHGRKQGQESWLLDFVYKSEQESYSGQLLEIRFEYILCTDKHCLVYYLAQNRSTWHRVDLPGTAGLPGTELAFVSKTQLRCQACLKSGKVTLGCQLLTG